MTSLIMTDADTVVKEVPDCLFPRVSPTEVLVKDRALDPGVTPALLRVSVPVLLPLMIETELTVAVAPLSTNEAGKNDPETLSEKVA